MRAKQTQTACAHAAKHFYGGSIVGLGAWEAAAYAKLLPTITRTVRDHPRLRPIAASWLLGLVFHLFRKDTCNLRAE